jgi:Protein of unknown function (DUF2806)
VPEPPIAPEADPLELRHLAKVSDAAASVCNNIINRVAAAIGIPYDDLAVVVRARRQAKAKGLLARADAEAEARPITPSARIQRDVDSAAALHREQREQRAQRRFLADAVRHQDNIEAITVEAIERVIEQSGEDKTVQPTQELSPDWMAEFFDMCKNVADAKMRALWGRVLAGQAQQPGSFSIRSLLSLKTLLADEAEQFRLAVNLCFNRHVIFRGNDSTAALPFGVSYGNFLVLSAAGLLAPAADAGLTLGNAGEVVVIYYEPYVLVFKRSAYPFVPMHIPIWSLSAVGRELATLINVEHNWDYVRRLMAHQQPAGWELDVILAPDGFPAPPPDLPTQRTKK